MKKLKVLLHIIRTTGLSKIILSFVFYLSAVAIILAMIEPDINNLGDSLWFCFASTTTIGYGDIVVRTTAGRLLTVVLGLYGLFFFAYVSGVVISFYNEINKMSTRESVLEFMDKLERLEELSKEELSALSESVRKNRYHLK